MAINLRKLLNKAQADAAETIEGPLLIIAGAGSGKTRMITYRIAKMLESGIKEDNILALTFTNKAAKEMSDRIKELSKKKLKGLTATTFHSFGLILLKKYIHHLGYHNNFSLYDANDNQALIKNCIISLGYQIPDFNIYSIASLFSDVKTGRKSFNEEESAVREIYNEWLLCQKAYNVVDFDDLILLPIRIFEKKPFVLEEVQERYRYILVDEFQDTSLLQYKMVSLIAEKYRNIAVVGDDDQSIYSWRGANYENIRMFEHDFPERKEFKLEQNYRSSGTILKAANAVIKNNTERKDYLWYPGAISVKLCALIDDAKTNVKAKPMMTPLIAVEGNRLTNVKAAPTMTPVIAIKCNHLTDAKICSKLIEAAKAGVKVILIVRSTCTLPHYINIPNLEIRSIAGKYLEHDRIFAFGYEDQDGNLVEKEAFISTADLMPRNLENRIEFMMRVPESMGMLSFLVEMAHTESDPRAGFFNFRL